MRRRGRAAWYGLAALLTIFLVCGGGFVWMYHALSKVAQLSSVVRINHEDARLQQAAKMAQETLPRFITRLGHPQPGDTFAIKARFATSVGLEYLWLKDPRPIAGGFVGTLDQRPIALRAKKGDHLKVKAADVYDWLVRRSDGSMAGGFTEIALGKGG